MIDIFICEKTNTYGAWTYINAATLTGIDGLSGDDDECEGKYRRLYVEHRGSALFELCRELVALGFPDQPWRSFWPPHSPSMLGKSIHRAALMTVNDSPGNGSNAGATRFARWSTADFRDGALTCKACGHGRQMFRTICLKCAVQTFEVAETMPDLVVPTRP